MTMKIDAGWRYRCKQAMLSVVAEHGIDVGVAKVHRNLLIVFAVFDGEESWNTIYTLEFPLRILLPIDDEKEAHRRIVEMARGLLAAGDLGGPHLHRDATGALTA